MKIIERGQLAGAFKGFKGTDRVFKFFSSRTKWRQNEYKYHYHYAYMPRAQVVERNGRCYLEVDGLNVSVNVVRVY